MTRPTPVTVLGAGAWGTALAASVAPRHPTVLWSRDAAQAEAIAASHQNAKYLAGVDLPRELAVTSDFDAAVRHGQDGLLIIGTPMSGLQGMLASLPAHCAGVVWLCKGFQEGTGLLGHEIARRVRPNDPRVGIVSGPSFALEVARGQPAALVAASADDTLATLAADVLHGERLRMYVSNDPVGVEVGGAVKNVLAIATGIADGMQLGLNARAALITRGLAEITRLGIALGGRAETFMGLSGLGDLVLTATGDLSRNRKVGLALASGQPLAEILRQLGHVAEGVACAATVLTRARQLSVDMPITEAVVQVLQGVWTPQQAIQSLMSRESQREA